MFDNSLPGLDAFADADDAGLAAAITGWQRVESAAAARRLAAIAELVRRRSRQFPERAQWACDNWDGTAAEVAAALGVSHRLASSQMCLAVALDERLPQVAGLFAEGLISTRLVSAIAWHTHLITSALTVARVDAELAAAAVTLGSLTAVKAADAIDAVIARHDPAALRRTRALARSREIVIDTEPHQSGTSALWGRLYSTDARLLDERLDQLARSVCDQDSRTLAQRRADALGVLAAGGHVLACNCTRPDCPAADRDARAGATTIYVLAEASTLSAQPDPHMSGEQPPTPPAGSALDALGEPPEPDPPAVQAPAVLVGGGPIPAPLLAELIRAGATLTELKAPADLGAEPGYRPSAALAAFIRARDLTCRWPGCDRPAGYCDIDHAIPRGAGGPTHPANLRCLCRLHHLIKTFWTGQHGWRDRQLPDGTIIFTSPTGQTYTTHPASRLLFPKLCLPTTPAPAPPPTPPPNPHRGLMMPTRTRTRAQDRAHRINTERNKPPLR